MLIPDNIVELVKSRQMTGRAAAALLHISEQKFSRLFKLHTRVPGLTKTHRKEQHDLLLSRREHRKQLVDDIKGKRKTIEQAAKAGKCSIRTIYRYLNGEHL